MTRFQVVARLKLAPLAHLKHTPYLADSVRPVHAQMITCLRLSTGGGLAGRSQRVELNPGRLTALR